MSFLTYELHRCSSSGGFGFDLKGDRPAIIGSVRKGSIAEQAGLKEGDLVISINNKKVTDLDHDQVVRLVGQSKSKLILQVTKIKSMLTDANPTGSLNRKSVFPGNNKDQHLTNNKKAKTATCKKFKNNMATDGMHPPPQPIQQAAFMKPSALAYSNSVECLNNNTKTTEEDEEDESDYDYDFYLMTGRRRHRHHNKLNRYIESEDPLTDNTNLSDSQTGSIPSVSLNSIGE